MLDRVLNAIESGRNIAILGGGGVGKTYLSNQIIHKLGTRKKIATTASTGVAAIHLWGGTTIHKFSGIGNRPLADYDRIIGSRKFNTNIAGIIETTDILFIDEVSMVRSDTFTLIDKVCKYARGNDNPFGGLQIIVVGDFFQLPPVADSSFPQPFAFDSESWREANFVNIVLTKVWRQSDQEFIQHLNNIRVGKCPDETDRFFKARTNLQVPDEKLMPLKIVGTNKEVDEHNQVEIDKLQTPLFQSVARRKYRDRSDLTELLNEVNAIDELILKIGCQVMILANDPEGAYANGTIGLFSGITYGKISGQPQVEVTLSDFSTVVVPMKKWKLYDENYDPDYLLECEDMEEARDYEEIHTRAYYQQYPIRPAYAITVHKAQGMSMDRIDFDARKIFAPGQVYVGLSRAKTLEGLRIFNWDRTKVWANKDALRFYNSIGGIQ